MPDQASPIHLLRFTGEDRPGLTAELSAALADHGAAVLDLNQAVIHEMLLLGMLVRWPGRSDQQETGLNAIHTVAESHGLRLKVRPIADDAYDRWVAQQGKPRHILTLLTRTLTAAQLAAVSRVVAEQSLNIDVIHRLSGRPARPGGADDHADDRRACVEFSLRGQPADPDAMHERFMQLGSDLHLDLAWQKDDGYRRARRMVVFDMDSTLIRAEVIDELAKEAGAGEAVAQITDATMRGELDFDDSLRRRVAALAGLPASILAAVAERLELTEGADTLVRNLKAFGYKTAVLSGGFTYFGHHLQQQLGLDHVHANRLEIENGTLTGRVLGDIVNGPRKAQLLEQLAADEGIHRRQVVAVGDGANDLPMLRRAGLGIAFHAKPLVRRQAEQSVSTLGLDAVLYLLGVPDHQRLPPEVLNALPEACHEAPQPAHDP
ncbi:MAG: phosphoserine phosphatase SerB [Planctomycetota bacterium]